MNKPQYIYSMYKLSKVYPGGKQVIKDISLSFLPGAKIGVLGGNGAGKSTLLKIMAGVDNEYNGEAKIADGIKVGYLAQEPELNSSLNVYENVMEGMAEAKKLVDDFNAISLKFSEDLTEDEMNQVIAKQGELQEQIDNMDAWDLDRKAEIAMDALSLPPAESKIDHLSGGEKRRVALAQLLLSNPDFLLLDEPTNHLDALSVAWLQRFLHDFPGTVVTITHDRYFLDEVAGWILELDRGEGIPFKGNYSSWLEQKQKRLELEGKAEEARKRKINEELEWIKSAPRARQAKSKARITSYEELVSKEQKKEINTGNLVIPPAPRLGNDVITFKNVSKSFDDKLLIDNLSFKLPPGGIIGVIGANGVGKTTLARTLDPDTTLFMDLEAGDAAIERWPIDVIRPQTWEECRDFACFLGGPNPALTPDQPYSVVEYEKVTSDPKIVTKQLLEFCDLKWDENCLKYYKVNKSAIDTASANQANKPIYKDSVNKFENYRNFFKG